MVAKLLPAPLHGFFQGILGAELSGPFSKGRGGPGGWWFGAEVACELSPVDTLLPDLAGWRRDRLAGPPLPLGSVVRCTGGPRAFWCWLSSRALRA